MAIREKLMNIFKVTRLMVVLLALVVLLGVFVISALAQTTNYKLDWSSLNSGGGESSGDNYVLMGTIIGRVALSGGNYTLIGGFQSSGGSSGINGYLPIILRD